MNNGDGLWLRRALLIGAGFFLLAAIVLTFIETISAIICGVTSFTMSVARTGLYQKSRQFRGR